MRMPKRKKNRKIIRVYTGLVPIIPALGKWNLKDLEFGANLIYTESSG